MPNGFGDMLAGVFSPLAFLWLVLGFIQQGQELSASVRALELQGQELQHSVEQQRQIVEVAKAEMKFQIDRLTHEQEVEIQRSRSKFEMECFGNSSSRVDGERSHHFRVANFGKEVLKFEVKEQGGEKILTSCSKLGHGNPQQFQISLSAVGKTQKTVRLGFVDERGRSIAEYWIIRSENGDISLGQEDEMRDRQASLLESRRAQTSMTQGHGSGTGESPG